jgi:hypothetical protein
MAFEKGVTEIADSEDDSMPSSPALESTDKLCAMAGAPYQERQDALHEADGLHQALAQRNASAAEGLDVDLHGVSSDVDASKVDQTNMTSHDTSRVQDEGAIIEVGRHDLELHSQLHLSKAEPATADISDEFNVAAAQPSPTDALQLCSHTPAKRADTHIRRQRSTNQTAKDNLAAQREVKPVEDAMAKNVEHDLAAGCQEQQSTVGGINPVAMEQSATGSIHPTTLDASSKAPSTAGHDLSDTGVDLEVPSGWSTCKLQDYATRDGRPQQSTEGLCHAASGDKTDQHSSEITVCPRSMLIHFIRSHSIGSHSNNSNWRIK